jgi:hypothetical protein
LIKCGAIPTSSHKPIQTSLTMPHIGFQYAWLIGQHFLRLKTRSGQGSDLITTIVNRQHIVDMHRLSARRALKP